VNNSGFANGFEHFLCFGAKEVESGQRFLSKVHKQRCQQQAADDEFLRRVKDSGIVDEDWYSGQYGSTACAAEHSRNLHSGTFYSPVENFTTHLTSA